MRGGLLITGVFHSVNQVIIPNFDSLVLEEVKKGFAWKMQRMKLGLCSTDTKCNIKTPHFSRTLRN